MEPSAANRQTREDRLLYVCSNQRLSPHQADEISLLASSSVDWDYVLRVSRSHCVSPLIFNSIAGSRGASGRLPPIPETVVSSFKQDIARNIAVKHRRSEGLRSLLALCSESGIDVMLIKGAALDALVYDRAWYTLSADVDLLIRQGIQELSPQDRKEIGSLCAGYFFECDSFAHEDFSLLSREHFQVLWRNARKLRCDYGEALFLSPEDQLITCCLNACKHKFFRLKNISDVAETVRRFAEIRWEVVSETSRTFRCANIVYAALRVAGRTVGLCQPGGDLARTLGVAPMRAAIIDLTIERLLRLRLEAVRRGLTFRMKTYPISVVLPYACYHGSQICRRLRSGITGRGNPFERF